MDAHFDSMKDEEIQKLYTYQEKVYSKLMNILPYTEDIVLIGGTPLARCFLNHRISFDLDFAVNPKKNFIKEYIEILKENNFIINRYSIEKEEMYDNAFFYAKEGSLNIEFSFIQDRRYSNFIVEYKKMGFIDVKTVSLNTLYYNKLRTIAGDYKGLHRNKIRDVFDIAILSNQYKKIENFIEEYVKKIDSSFSEDDFYESLINFNWIEIENQCIYPINNWNGLDSIDKLIDFIDYEANLVIENENYWEVDNQDVAENNKQSDFPCR